MIETSWDNTQGQLLQGSICNAEHGALKLRGIQNFATIAQVAMTSYKKATLF